MWGRSERCSLLVSKKRAKKVPRASPMALPTAREARAWEPRGQERPVLRYAALEPLQTMDLEESQSSSSESPEDGSRVI